MIGRYLRPDPSGQSYDLASYKYANYDPINAYDPNGKQPAPPWPGARTHPLLYLASHLLWYMLTHEHPMVTDIKTLAKKRRRGDAPEEEGDPPPNLTPPGAGRRGAFREARRRCGIPTSSQPDRTDPNEDRNRNKRPDRWYKWFTPDGEIGIRDDSRGDYHGPNSRQNRGPHFNDPNGGHYDY